MAGSVVSLVNLVVQVHNQDAIGRMAGSFGKLRRGFQEFGVTTIFLDRLMQSFGRGWEALTRILNVDDFTEQASKLNKMSAGLGMQSDQLSAFVGLSQRYGAEINDVPDLIATMQDKLMEFADGNKTVVDDLKGTNLLPEDFVGKGPLDRFLTLVDGLKNLDRQTRSAVMSRFFGDDVARKYAPLADRGSKAIIEDMKAMAASGQVLTKAQIEMGEATRTSLGVLSGVFTGFRNNMTQSLLPVVKRAAEEAAVYMVDLARVAAQHFDEMSGMFQRLYTWLTGQDIFKGLITNANDAFSAIQAAILGLVTMALLYLAPLIYSAMSFIAVWALLGLAAQDFYVYMQGGPSLIGDMLNSGNSFVYTFLGGIYAIYKAVVMLGEVAFMMLKEILQSPLLPVFFAMIVAALGFLLMSITAFFGVVFAFFRILNTIILGVIGVLEVVIGMIAAIYGAFVKLFFGEVGQGLQDFGKGLTKTGGGRIKNLFQQDIFAAGYMPTNGKPPTQNNIVVNNTVNSVNAPQTALAIMGDSATRIGDKVRE